MGKFSYKHRFPSYQDLNQASLVDSCKKELINSESIPSS